MAKRSFPQSKSRKASPRARSRRPGTGYGGNPPPGYGTKPAPKGASRTPLGATRVGG